MEIKLFIGLVVNPCKGEWFTVTDASDFETACDTIQALADSDPESGGEIMIADTEGLDLSKVGFSEIGDILDWVSNTHHDDSLIEAAFEYDRDNFRAICEDARGPFKSEGDFAEDTYADNEEIKALPSEVRMYIDYAAIERDWVMNGDYFELETPDGTYFVSSSF